MVHIKIPVAFALASDIKHAFNKIIKLHQKFFSISQGIVSILKTIKLIDVTGAYIMKIKFC